MSVHLEPASQLTFRRPLTQVTKELLLVTNPGNDPVMFKVKTTAPKQYCVRPNAGRVEPNSQVEVQIILQPFKEEPPADFKCKDKFLVQTAVIKPGYEALPVAEMWARVEAEDKAGIFQQKIKCVYLPPEEDPYLSNSQHVESVHPQATQPVPQPERVNETLVAAPPVAPPTTLPPPPPLVAEPVEPAPSKPSLETRVEPAASVQEPSVTEAPKERSMPSVAPETTTTMTATTTTTTTTVAPEKPEEEDAENKQLREDLQAARQLIEKLQFEVAKLQKEVEAGAKPKHKLAPTVQPQDAVHQHLAMLEKPHPTEGYPPHVVLAVASLVFIFTYLFF